MANAFNPYITPSQGAPTPATPTTLPPAGGVTVDLPIDKVNPTAADVTRTTQARLGMIDINPSARLGVKHRSMRARGLHAPLALVSPDARNAQIATGITHPLAYGIKKHAALAKRPPRRVAQCVVRAAL